MEEKRVPQCETTVIHAEVVERVSTRLLPDQVMSDIAEFFKVFGDPTRIRILQVLFEAEEMCVCDIAYLLNMSQSAISHQLRVLKQAGIVKYRKDGRVVYYSLDDDHIKSIFDQGYKHIVEEKEKR
ncbi:MAG: winged helix-turn-helix transcriptional regulator [Firmicutes bacterium]|jgi:ArsR family transcriptional regulator|nr:winged helix-turn-helix transcriptional regulator [Bacillota bacterium]